jgi:hypothetical protein
MDKNARNMDFILHSSKNLVNIDASKNDEIKKSKRIE